MASSGRCASRTSQLPQSLHSAIVDNHVIYALVIRLTLRWSVQPTFDKLDLWPSMFTNSIPQIQHRSHRIPRPNFSFSNYLGRTELRQLVYRARFEFLSYTERIGGRRGWQTEGDWQSKLRGSRRPSGGLAFIKIHYTLLAFLNTFVVSN